MKEEKKAVNNDLPSQNDNKINSKLEDPKNNQKSIPP